MTWPAPLLAPETASEWDVLPAAVLVLDDGGRARDLNQPFCRMSGLDRQGARGEGWWTALDAEARTTLRRLLPGRQSFNLSMRMEIPATGVRWVDCAASWDPAGDDGRGRYVCVLHDVSELRQAEAAVRSQAQRVRLVADNVPVLIASFDARNDACEFANSAYAAAFGLDPRSIIGRTATEIIGEEAAIEIAPHVAAVKKRREAVRYERLLDDPSGRRWIEVHLLPHLTDRGELASCFVLITDVTRFRQAERAAREATSRMEKFLWASMEGILFHREGLITDANPPLMELTGYPLGELIGRPVLDLMAADAAPRAASVLAAGAEVTYESTMVHRQGHRIPVECIVRSVSVDGVPHRMAIVRDLRDRQAAQARIQYLAHHDELTGLPNRTAFNEHMQHLTAAARAADGQLALLFIDLDHFKRVNDSLGHLCGDALLRRAAHRMRCALRSTDMVARFGGDEFLVVLPGIDGRPAIERTVGALLDAVSAPFDIEGQSISITPSVGIAVFPVDGETPEALLKHADHAMYQAKSRGRANYQFFESWGAGQAYAELVVESQLARAVERNEFVLHYQPKVRASDGVLVGAEALIRWQHPERGLLWPHAFVPVAEQRRLMLPIGLWVLREAASWARRWLVDHGRAVAVAVNLSSVQFREPDFIASVARVLKETGVPPQLVEIELTERMLMDDIDAVRSLLGRLRGLGLRIAVDDFGTGYSSLGHLKDLPIDRLKIDRSFVQGLPDDPGCVAIVRAMIQMAQELGMGVTAEGIERPEQQRFLQDLGCHDLQGDLIGAPLDAAAFGRAWARGPVTQVDG